MDPSPTPPLGELLEYRDFVRRLARHLVLDESAADDLVQEVWIAAWKRPMGLDSARAWLTRVTRNLASNAARAESRRQAREIEVARTRPEEKLEETERAFEVLKEVTAAVEELDEPYRSTILLAYFKELPHAQIATEMGVPLATVRTRLRRALARLRAQLDSDHGGHRAAWLGGLTTFATAGSGLLATGVLMGIALKLSAVALAATLVLIWSPWQARGPALDSAAIALEPQAGAAESVELPTTQLPTSAEPRIAVATAPDSRSDSSAADASQALGWFVECQIEALPPEEASRTTVTIRGEDGYTWPEDLFAKATFDSSGQAKVDVTRLVLGDGRYARTPLHALVLTTDSALRLPAKLRLPVTAAQHVMAEPSELEQPVVWHAKFELQPAAGLSGFVRLEDGTPVEGALVCAWSGEADAVDNLYQDQTASGADGSFRLRLARSGRFLVGASAEDLLPASMEAEAQLARVQGLAAALVLSKGASISGRALVGGRPAPQARVQIRTVEDRGARRLETRSGVHTFLLGRAGFQWRGRWITCAEDGSWSVSGLSPGEYVASINSLPTTRIRLSGYEQGKRTVAAPARDIDLEYGYGRVQLVPPADLPSDQKGVVVLTQANGTPTTLEFLPVNSIPMIAATPQETIEVVVEFPGRTPWRGTVSFPAAGEVASIPVPLEPGLQPSSLTIELKVTDKQPVTTLWLGLTPMDSPVTVVTHRQVATVEDAACTFTELPPGRYEAQVRVTDSDASMIESDYLDTTFEVELTPGKTTKTPLTLELGGKLSLAAHTATAERLPARLELRNRAGDPVQLTLAAFDGDTTQFNSWQLSTRAANLTCSSLPAGEYELSMWLDGYQRKTATIEVEAGQTTEVDWLLEAE